MKTKFIKNSYKKTIDNLTKKTVRHKCGFGCIFCGNSIYQYEYVPQNFNETLKPESEKIFLVCSTCYQDIISGKISKQQVIDQYKKPIAITREFENDFFSFTPKVYASLAKIFFIDTFQIIKINNINILSITQSTDDEPVSINAKFYDDNNKLALEIKDNETIGDTLNWDVEQTEVRTIIRKNQGKILLQFKFISPDVFEIEKINMMYDGNKIYTDPNKGKIFIRTKNGQTFDLNKEQVIAHGISITSKGVVFERPLAIKQKETLKNQKLDYRAFIDTGKIQSQ